MGRIVETDEQGGLYLSPQVLRGDRPHQRYELEIRGDTFVLRPVEEAPPQWAQLTPQQLAASIRDWGRQPRPQAPVLGEEALGREQIYD